MSRLVTIFQRLVESHKQENGESEEISYAAVIEALRRSHISEMEILQDFREVVVADLARGVAIYVEHGGPEAPTTLQIEHGREMMDLYNAILEAQRRILSLEKRKQWESAKSTSGSTSQESEKSPEPLSSEKSHSTKTEPSP